MGKIKSKEEKTNQQRSQKGKYEQAQKIWERAIGDALGVYPINQKLHHHYHPFNALVYPPLKDSPVPTDTPEFIATHVNLLGYVKEDTERLERLKKGIVPTTEPDTQLIKKDESETKFGANACDIGVVLGYKSCKLHEVYLQDWRYEYLDEDLWKETDCLFREKILDTSALEHYQHTNRQVLAVITGTHIASIRRVVDDNSSGKAGASVPFDIPVMLGFRRRVAEREETMYKNRVIGIQMQCYAMKRHTKDNKEGWKLSKPVPVFAYAADAKENLICWQAGENDSLFILPHFIPDAAVAVVGKSDLGQKLRASSSSSISGSDEVRIGQEKHGSRSNVLSSLSEFVMFALVPWTLYWYFCSGVLSEPKEACAAQSPLAFVLTTLGALYLKRYFPQMAKRTWNPNFLTTIVVILQWPPGLSLSFTNAETTTAKDEVNLEFLVLIIVLAGSTVWIMWQLVQIFNQRRGFDNGFASRDAFRASVLAAAKRNPYGISVLPQSPELLYKEEFDQWVFPDSDDAFKDLADRIASWVHENLPMPIQHVSDGTRSQTFSCCPPGSIGPATERSNRPLQGKMIEIPPPTDLVGAKPMPCYCTGAPLSSKTLSRIVVVFTDVYGIDAGHHKFFADCLAERLALGDNGDECNSVVIPDLFRGVPILQPWVKASNMATDIMGSLLGAPGMVFRLKNDYPPRKVEQDIFQMILPFLQNQLTVENTSSVQLSCVGFCFGGWVVGRVLGFDTQEQLQEEDDNNEESTKRNLLSFQCGVGIHPSFQPNLLHGETPTTMAERISKPLLLLPAWNDFDVRPGSKVVTVLTQNRQDKSYGEVSIEFPSMVHGWVSRGDPTDPNIAEAQDRALALTVDFIQKQKGIAPVRKD